MEREQLRISLIDLADGALASDEARAIEAALEEHPDLRQEYDDLRQAVELARALPPMTLPPELNERIRRAVDEAACGSPRPTLSIWVWVTGVAAALFLTVIGLRLFDGRWSDKASLARRTAADSPARREAGPPPAAAELAEERSDRRGAFNLDPREVSRKEEGLAVGKATEAAQDREREDPEADADDMPAAKADKPALPRPATPVKGAARGWIGDGRKQAPAARPRPSAKSAPPRAASPASGAEAKKKRSRFKSAGRSAGLGVAAGDASKPAPGMDSKNRATKSRDELKAESADKKSRPEALGRPVEGRLVDDGTIGTLSVEVGRDDAAKVQARIVRFFAGRVPSARSVPADRRGLLQDFGGTKLGLQVALADDEIAALRRLLGDAARVVPGARRKIPRPMREARPAASPPASRSDDPFAADRADGAGRKSKANQAEQGGRARPLTGEVPKLADGRVRSARSATKKAQEGARPPATEEPGSKTPRAEDKVAPEVRRGLERSSAGQPAGASGGKRTPQAEPEPKRLVRKRWVLVIRVK